MCLMLHVLRLVDVVIEEDRPVQGQGQGQGHRAMTMTTHQHSSAVVVVAVASSSSGVVGVVAWGQEVVNPSYEHLLPSSHPFA